MALSARQQRAVEALLTSTSQQHAATTAGVAARTLRRWLGEHEFSAAYREASRGVLMGTIARVRSASGEALETLREALQDESGAVRVRAAVALLDAALKVEADELLVRVERLEAWQTALPGGAR